MAKFRSPQRHRDALPETWAEQTIDMEVKDLCRQKPLTISLLGQSLTRKHWKKLRGWAGLAPQDMGLVRCHVATSSRPPFSRPVTPPLFAAPFHPSAFAMHSLSPGISIRAARWLCCCEPRWQVLCSSCVVCFPTSPGCQPL